MPIRMMLLIALAAVLTGVTGWYIIGTLDIVTVIAVFLSAYASGQLMTINTHSRDSKRVVLGMPVFTALAYLVVIVLAGYLGFADEPSLLPQTLANFRVIGCAFIYAVFAALLDWYVEW